jgi:hypothetical protein
VAVDPNDDVVLVMKRFEKEGKAKEGSVEIGFFWPQVTSPAPCRLTSICFSEYLRILPDPSALDRSGPVGHQNVVVLGLASKLCTHREEKSKHASPRRETALERHGICELEHYDGDGGKDRGQGWKKLGRGCHVW